MFDAEDVNRLGLAAQFFSFWLVTPEVLSPNTLHKLQTAIRRKLEFVAGLGPVGLAALGLVIAAVAIAFYIGTGRGLSAALKIALLLPALATMSWWILLAAEGILKASEAWKKRFAYGGALLFVGGTAAQFAATYGNVP